MAPLGHVPDGQDWEATKATATGIIDSKVHNVCSGVARILVKIQGRTALDSGPAHTQESEDGVFEHGDGRAGR